MNTPQDTTSSIRHCTGVMNITGSFPPLQGTQENTLLSLLQLGLVTRLIVANDVMCVTPRIRVCKDQMRYSSLPRQPLACSDTYAERNSLDHGVIGGRTAAPQKCLNPQQALRVQKIHFYCINQWALRDFTATQGKPGLRKGQTCKKYKLSGSIPNLLSQKLAGGAAQQSAFDQALQVIVRHTQVLRTTN